MKPPIGKLVAVHLVTSNTGGLRLDRGPVIDYARDPGTAVLVVAVQSQPSQKVRVYDAAGDDASSLQAAAILLRGLADHGHVFIAMDVPTQAILLRVLLKVEPNGWFDAGSYLKYRPRADDGLITSAELMGTPADLLDGQKFKSVGRAASKAAAYAHWLGEKAIGDALLPDWEWEVIQQTCRVQIAGIRIDVCDVQDLRAYAMDLGRRSEVALADVGIDVRVSDDEDTIVSFLRDRKEASIQAIVTPTSPDDGRSSGEPDFAPFVKHAQEFRASKRLLELLPLYLEQAPRLSNHLHYYGYRVSGRFTSGGKDMARFNLHGLDKATAVRAARGVVVPPRGKAFVAGDSKAIEPRVLAFLADEADLLKRFASDEDVYTWFAGVVRPGASRIVGKEPLISLGYGMGLTSLQDKMRQVLPDLDPQVVEAAYGTYKRMFPKSEALGPAYVRALTDVANGADPTEVGHVHFQRIGVAQGQDVVVAARLPTGRNLFFRLRPVVGEQQLVWVWPSSKGQQRLKELNEHLVKQTIVQAVARDIVVGQGLGLEDRGLRLAFSNADELVVVAPRCDCEQPNDAHAGDCAWVLARETVRSCMSVVPDIFPGLTGLPLDCKVNDDVERCYW